MIDPKNIIRLSSHEYELPVYAIGSNGVLDFGTCHVVFCKGNKENPDEGHGGVFTEYLIELCRQHLRSVNVGELKSQHTTAAIHHLTRALEILADRQKDRSDRGVAQTYQK